MTAALLPMNWVRITYLRWLLRNTEDDIKHAKRQVSVFEARAEELRVQLADLGAL
jgi:hypothetical protein